MTIRDQSHEFSIHIVQALLARDRDQLQNLVVINVEQFLGMIIVCICLGFRNRIKNYEQELEWTNFLLVIMFPSVSIFSITSREILKTTEL